MPAHGLSTLPQGAFAEAEHLTFSLLNVHTGENGRQVLAAVDPYTTAVCQQRQATVLDKVGPAMVGLSVLIDGASQSGATAVDVQFGGADQLTQDAIFDLVDGYQATMRIGLTHSGTS